MVVRRRIRRVHLDRVRPFRACGRSLTRIRILVIAAVVESHGEMDIACSRELATAHQCDHIRLLPSDSTRDVVLAPAIVDVQQHSLLQASCASSAAGVDIQAGWQGWSQAPMPPPSYSYLQPQQQQQAFQHPSHGWANPGAFRSLSAAECLAKNALWLCKFVRG